MRYTLPLLLLAAVLLAPTGAAQDIAFKTRTFTPDPAESLRSVPVTDGDHSYVLVQFEDALPAPEALFSRGVRPVHYVDGRSVVARVEAGTAKAAIGDVRWMGTLETTEKVSSGVNLREARTYVVVEAYPQIAGGDLDRWIRAEGGRLIDHPDLPEYTQLAEVPSAAVDAIARRNGVAFVHQAGDHLLKGDRTHFCPGAMTHYGPVSPFATTGPGWDGPGLGTANLTYYYVNGTPDLPGDDEQIEVEAGLQGWADVATINWTESFTPNLDDQIDILWGAGAHGDGFPFDGPGGVLAHAFFPAPDPNPETIGGDMHFDEDETWTNDGTNFDTFIVALHEAGHSLGMLHSGVSPAVMEPFYNGAITGLFQDDIDGIRTLYGTRVVVLDPPPLFSKAFAPSSLPEGGTSTLTFTIDNTASGMAATGMSFTDTFPAGLVVATSGSVSNSCGGTVTATDGSGSASLAGGTVAAGATCTISVDVTAAAAGVYPNTTGDLMSSLGNSGTASATVTFTAVGGLPDVDIDLISWTTPPMRNDAVFIRALATNNEPMTVRTRVYFTVDRPDGSNRTYSVLSTNFPGNSSFQVQKIKKVKFPLAADAPAGTYTVTIYVSEDIAAGGAIYDSDSFTFVLPPLPPITGETSPEAMLLGIPDVLELRAPSPNPARGAVTLGYALPEAGDARVSVVDALGREVAEVASGAHEAGRYTVQFDTGSLPAGVYTVRMSAGAEALVRRFTIVR